MRTARRAALVLLLATAALAVLARDVTHDGPMAAADHRIGAWLQAWLAPSAGAPWVGPLRWVSDLHKPRVLAVATIAVSLLLLALRRRGDALFVLLVVPSGSVVNHLIKHTLERPRPGLAATPGLPTDFAFPSGHVATAALLYGVLALLALRHAPHPAVRGLAVAAAGLLVALVGASRVVLGAHHASDVAGGALLGIGWIAVGVLVARAVRWRTGPRDGFRS